MCVLISERDTKRKTETGEAIKHEISWVTLRYDNKQGFVGGEIASKYVV